MCRGGYRSRKPRTTSVKPETSPFANGLLTDGVDTLGSDTGCPFVKCFPDEQMSTSPIFPLNVGFFGTKICTQNRLCAAQNLESKDSSVPNTHCLSPILKLERGSCTP